MVVGSLRVVLLENGKDAEGEPAGEREGSSSADRRDRSTGATMACRTVAVRHCPRCARHRQKRCRCSKPTLNGARELDPKPRATSSGVAPHPTAALVPPALPCFGGARGAMPLTGHPSGRRGEIRGCSAARTVELRTREWRQEETERSGGATGLLLTERPVRGEGQAPWQGSGPQAPEAPPEEPEHHARRRPPRWQGTELSGQPAEGLGTRHGRDPVPIAQNS